MVRKICLDSDVAINLLQNEEFKSVLGSFDAEFCMTSVNCFEVWYGKRKTEPIEEFLEWMDIYSFDKKSATLAAEILLGLRKEGKVLDYRDVFVAAVCITNGLELASLNVKHFERMKKFGLKLVKLDVN